MMSEVDTQEVPSVYFGHMTFCFRNTFFTFTLNREKQTYRCKEIRENYVCVRWRCRRFDRILQVWNQGCPANGDRHTFRTGKCAISSKLARCGPITSARDRNVIYMLKQRDYNFFYCLCVHASFHYRHRLLWSRVSRLTFRISIKQLQIFMSVIKWYFSALSCLIINGLYDSGFTQLCLILNQLMYCSFGGYFFFYINL